jgi:hypothetical protein
MEINTGNTKEIMANSQIKITNPDFNKIVLYKIIKRQKKKLIITHIFFYLLIVALTAGIIVTRTGGLGSLADDIQKAIVQLGTWFLTYEFTILPFFILLIIKGLIDITLHHRFHN